MYMTQNADGEKRQIQFLFATLLLLPILPDVFAPFFIIIPFLAFVLCNKNWFSDFKSLYKSKNLLAIFGSLNLIWVFVCIFSSKFMVDSFVMSLLWLWCTLAFLAVLMIARKKDAVSRSIEAILWAGLLSGIIAVLQYTFNNFKWIPLTLPNPFWKHVNGITDHFFRYKISYLEDNMRSNSTYVNSNVYSTFLLVVIPLSIYYIDNAKTRKQLTFGIVSFVISVLALFVTFSRGAYVALAITLLAMTVLILVLSKSLNKKWSVLVTGTTLLLTGSIPFLSIMPDSVQARMGDILVNDNSKVTRPRLWEISGHLFVKRPITGYGTGMNSQWDIFKHQYNINEPHAHNDLFQLLLEGGVPRVIFTFGLVVVFFCFAVYIVRKGRHNEKILSLAFMAAMLGIIIQGSINYTFVDPKLTAYYMLLIAIMGGFYYSIKEKQQISLRKE